MKLDPEPVQLSVGNSSGLGVGGWSKVRGGASEFEVERGGGG